MKNIFSGLFIFILVTVSAQTDSSFVQVTVLDKVHRETIPNVSVLINSEKNCYVSTNQKGIFCFKIDSNKKYTLTFNHPLFQSALLELEYDIRFLDDTLSLEVFLEPSKLRELKEIVLKPPGKPDTVFESDRLSVADFELLQDGRLILLTYPKQLKKGSELLLYDGMNVSASFSLPGMAQELVRDFRGNTHVLCLDNVFGVLVNRNQIGISSIERGYFMKYVAPIVDTSYTKYFLSNFNKNYPAFEYYAYDLLDSTYSDILHIEDELMMELYRSEYKWVDVRTKLWAKNQEIQTGIDAEIWVGANYFTQSVYYKELYAPLFFKNDTLYIFDYYKDRLFSFDIYGRALDSVPIYHHYQPKASGWKRSLLQDHVTGEIYAVFEKNGYSFLGRVDLKTGEIIEKVILEFKYVDKIAIFDNFVYYVYRPFESNQKKFLYKERLPYSFSNSTVSEGIESLEK
jgi:hypothetical protein